MHFLILVCPSTLTIFFILDAFCTGLHIFRLGYMSSFWIICLQLGLSILFLNNMPSFRTRCLYYGLSLFFPDYLNIMMLISVTRFILLTFTRPVAVVSATLARESPVQKYTSHFCPMSRKLIWMNEEWKPNSFARIWGLFGFPGLRVSL